MKTPGIFIILIFMLSCGRSSEMPDSALIVKAEEFIEQGLDSINTAATGIAVKLKYATEDNFTGKNVYGTLKTAYLRPEAIEMLLKANETLQKEHPGLHFLIYDAARPRRIQQKLWDSTDIPENERHQYVANPETGSIHNYGCAVDLTLATADGTPLDMGTGFDNFTETAHTNREEELLEAGLLTNEQLANRRILRDIMTGAGFHTINSEWWHFNAFTLEETKARFKIIE